MESKGENMMKKAKNMMATMLSALLIMILTVSGMPPAVANQIDFGNMYSLPPPEPLTVHQAQNHVISPPTHSIHLEVSQSSDPSMLVADGFVNVIFNDYEHFTTILPESFTIATPYFLTLPDAHMLVHNGIEFTGWLALESNIGISTGQTILITGSGTVNLYALWDFNNVDTPPPPNPYEAFQMTEDHEYHIFTHEYAILHEAPTHDIHLEASQSSEPGMLVADGFVNVTFNYDGPFIAVVPESFTIATPYILTLPDAHIPIRNGIEFTGWLAVESNIAISPGQTVLISGSGTVTLYALWDFNNAYTPPPPNPYEAFQVTEGHEYYFSFPPPETKYGVEIPECYVELMDVDNLVDEDITSNLARITHAFISGTPRVGLPLTANFSLSSFVNNPIVTYQWQRWNGSIWVNIAGGTGRTFTPVAADANGFIRVRILGTGFNVATGGWYSEWVQVNPNLVNISSVRITGTLRVGSTLTANVTYSASVNNPAVTFQWQRWNGSAWVNIAGATRQTYVPTTADADRFIAVIVRGTGTNVSTNPVASASVQIAPNLVNISSVRITGTLRVGSTLTANVTYSGSVSNPAVTFQWQRQSGSTWVNIAGATRQTYVPTAADANALVRVRVQGTGTNVSTNPVTSASVQIASNLVNINNVSITGTLRVGSTLNANVTYSGSVNNPAVTFQWQRQSGSTWVNIAGATRQTYVPTAADANALVRVRVQGTGTNVSTTPRYSSSVRIAPNLVNISSVRITGTLRVGSTLTANVTYSASVNNPAVTFQWQRWTGSAWVNIAGATRQTYVPTAADADSFILVRVQGTGVNVSTAPHYSASAQIAPGLVNISSVRITGTLRVGSTLTANVTYSGSVNGPAVTYQWQRWNGSAWVNIAGATRQTYVPTTADANSFILVRVQGTGVNVSTAPHYSAWVQIESLRFAAFLIGYGNRCPVTLVSNNLTNIGYTSRGTFNNSTGTFASASTVWARARESDVVFIGGHGANAASMLVQDRNRNAVELLSAASGLTNQNWFQPLFRPAINNQVVIGADFLTGSTTRTNSTWNDRTRWAILYTCSQLNTGAEGNGNYWNGLNNAQIWARTMLGSPNRMHGILGFYGVAPSSTNEETGYPLLGDFLSMTTGSSNNSTLVSAWRDAHNGGIFGRRAANWAALYHQDNATDRFDNFTARTSDTVAPRIFLVRRGTSARQIGLNALNVNENDGLAFAVENTSSDINPYLSISFSDNIINHAARQRIEQILVSEENHVLRFESDGSITFRNTNVDLGVQNMRLQMNEEQAVEAARSHLDNLGLLPADSNYRVFVSSTERSLFDIATGEFTNSETIGFTVNFVRQINGIDVFSDRGDGISISFDVNGITGLHHNWRNMTVAQAQRQVTTNQITVEQAIESLKGIYSENYLISSLPAMLNVSNAYVIRNGIVTAVWMFSEEHDLLNMVMLDVITGERVAMH